MVGELTEFVSACRQLGYEYPGLTAGEIAEMYGAQDGLDLRALDVDVAALRAAAAMTDDVAGAQAGAVASLRAEWAGTGADAADGFLTRHQRAGEAVNGAISAAADTLAVLRDDLWRAVDAKVAATLELAVAADGRRGAWLAAARTLTTGTGDRATASEIVDLEVKPFVDNTVGGQWLAAMRTSSDAVVAAYEAATARLSGAGHAVFEVPFDLGPRPEQAQGPTQAPTQGRAAEATSFVPMSATAPAASGVPAAVAPAAFDPPTVAAAPPSAAPPPLAEAALGAPPASPAMPALGSGASGLGSQLADLLGGFGGLSESGELDSDTMEPDDIGDADETDEPEDLDEELEEEADDVEEDSDEDVVVEEPEEPEELVGSEPTPTPTPTPPPGPVAEPLAAPPPPLPEEPPPPVEQTPCEIAADELPQVGE